MNQWLFYPRRSASASVQLVCFPYAGGGPWVYGPWAAMLPTFVEVCGVLLPGRGPRINESPFRRMEPLVETLANVLEPHLHGPFAFFGHSMGALIAYELARYLRRQRARMPVHLFLSGRGAPHLPLAELSHSLPTPAFLQRVQRLNGIPPAVLEDDEMLQLFLPVLRADFELCETYVHRQEPGLDCPISVFGGVRDQEVSTESLQAWRAHTSGPFGLKLFEGDHFYLTTEPRPLVQAVADGLYQDVYGS